MRRAFVIAAWISLLVASFSLCFTDRWEYITAAVAAALALYCLCILAVPEILTIGRREVAELISLIGVGISAVGVITFGSQAFGWLRTGQWTEYRVNDVFQLFQYHPFTNWAGLQKIIEWFLLLPLWIATVCLGGLLASVSASN